MYRCDLILQTYITHWKPCCIAHEYDTIKPGCNNFRQEGIARTHDHVEIAHFPMRCIRAWKLEATSQVPSRFWWCTSLGNVGFLHATLSRSLWESHRWLDFMKECIRCTHAFAARAAWAWVLAFIPWPVRNIKAAMWKSHISAHPFSTWIVSLSWVTGHYSTLTVCNEFDGQIDHLL